MQMPDTLMSKNTLLTESYLSPCRLGAVQHVHLCGRHASGGVSGRLLGCGPLLRGGNWRPALRLPVRNRGSVHVTVYLQRARDRAPLRTHVQLPGLPGG